MWKGNESMRRFCITMIVISVISIIGNLWVMANGGEFSISNILSSIMSIIGLFVMFRLLGETESMEHGIDLLENDMEYKIRNGKGRS